MDKGRRPATDDELNMDIEDLEALNERFRIVASQNLRDIAYELVDVCLFFIKTFFMIFTD